MMLFTGSANPALAYEVASYLGLTMGDATLGRFADGEIHLTINESVRGKDVYVVQSLSRPVNDHVMELLVMIDALKRSSVKSITAVLPYYAYARQDRQDRPRAPITARLVADLLMASGVHRVMAMDLHAAQIQGFFGVPFEHLFGSRVLLTELRRIMESTASEYVVVAPDAGGVERARYISTKLSCPLAIIDKRRPRPNVSEVMHVIGDVDGKTAFIIDDMIDTAGTLCSAATALKANGAQTVYAFATHGLFNGPAVERIATSELESVFVTNTIPLDAAATGCERIKAISVGPTIGEAIKRVHVEQSVSSLFA
jgi:ribose-phosphate pyrophosphokinase